MVRAGSIGCLKLRNVAALLTLVALLAGPGRATAAVTVFTDEAAFQLATGAPIVATFNAKAFGATAAFSEGGVSFAAHPPLNNLYIIDGSVTNTHPVPTSKGLTGNGADDIDLSFPALTLAAGFNDITNRYAAPVVTVYAPDGTVLLSYTLTQGANTYGFVGFLSDTPIGKVRWLATSGNLENTLIDNVRVASATTPATGSTLGRIKSTYR